MLSHWLDVCEMTSVFLSYARCYSNDLRILSWWSTLTICCSADFESLPKFLLIVTRHCSVVAQTTLLSYDCSSVYFDVC